MLTSNCTTSAALESWITPAATVATCTMLPGPLLKMAEATEFVSDRMALSMRSFDPSRKAILSVLEASIVWLSIVAIE